MSNVFQIIFNSKFYCINDSFCFLGLGGGGTRDWWSVMASDHHQHTQVTSQLAVGTQQQQAPHPQLSSVNNNQSTQLLSQQPQQQTPSSLDHHPVSLASSGGGSQPQASCLPDQPQQQFCLRWNNFQSNIVSSFETLLNHEELVDVTLSAEGKCVRAHKVLLSACSPYFRELFQVRDNWLALEMNCLIENFCRTLFSISVTLDENSWSSLDLFTVVLCFW